MAAVVLSVLIGVPLGIVAGRSDRFMGFISPILDVMQIMPTFAYLAPLTLFFLIGPASAVIATLIYALPAAIRITAYGIRGVADADGRGGHVDGLDAAPDAALKVQIPMARPQIVLAVNQTMMMALSMVVITALIDAPGLGKNITRSLETLNVGTAFDAGIAIVIMAIVLDRLTTRASERAERQHRSGVVESARRRRTIIFGCRGRRPPRRRHRRLHGASGRPSPRASPSPSPIRSTRSATGSRRTPTTTRTRSRTP